MKKGIALLLALMLTAALTGCGSKTNSSDKAEASQQSAVSDQPTVSESTEPSAAESQESQTDSTVSPASSSDAQPLEPQKLLLFPLENGEKQILRGIRLTGNRIGSDINEKDPGTEGIRCIFALNEWVEIYPDADVVSGLKCWAFHHKKDPSFYHDNTLSADTEGFAQVCELNQDPEDKDMNWGSFYLNPEECEPGLYDLVFTYQDKAVGVLLTRFYQEQDIESKSDAELEALMKGILSTS